MGTPIFIRLDTLGDPHPSCRVIFSYLNFQCSSLPSILFFPPIFNIIDVFIWKSTFSTFVKLFHALYSQALFNRQFKKISNHLSVCIYFSSRFLIFSRPAYHRAIKLFIFPLCFNIRSCLNAIKKTPCAGIYFWGCRNKLPTFCLNSAR